MKNHVVNEALLSRLNKISQAMSKKTQALHSDEPPKKWFNFVAKDDDTTELFIYDEISSYWGIGANEFSTALSEVKSTNINLYINSPGGSVFEGYAIYSLLARHSAKINVFIDGWAASIASVIAMAGDTIKISEHAQVMIHKPWGFSIGDAMDMRSEADVLDDLQDTIVDIYHARAGGDRDEINQWVNDETWFKGQAAVDAGFADEVIPLKKRDDDKEDKVNFQATADAKYFDSIFTNLPDEVRSALAEARPAQKDMPETEREFKNFLKEHGFSGTRADAIAGNGFKEKNEPRDAAPSTENPTNPDPRDVAAKREASVATIKRFLNKRAIERVAKL